VFQRQRDPEEWQKTKEKYIVKWSTAQNSLFGSILQPGIGYPGFPQLVGSEEFEEWRWNDKSRKQLVQNRHLTCHLWTCLEG
jgi:hypothetical protein